MEFEQLNLGANPNDSTGDPLRVGGQKINNNFELLNSFGHIGVTNANPVDIIVNTPVLVDTWNFNLFKQGYYDLHVAIEWSLNATNQDAVLRFDVNGVTGIEINQEPKDTNNKIFFSTFALQDLQQGANVIEFYARKENDNANTLTIYSTRFTARYVNIIS